jgi:Zn-dependent protease
LVPGLSAAAYLSGGVAVGVAVLASIFVHEASHAVVAQRYGVKVSSITLWLLGGVAHLEDEAPSPRAEAWIAGAGPASSVAVAIAALGIGGVVAATEVAPLLSAVLLWVGGLNAILALFNLLPGAPLDGGRLLHAWLWKRRGDRASATVGAAKAGRGFGIAIAVLGAIEILAGNFGGFWTAFIGWFLYTAAGQEAKAGRLSGVLNGRKLADIMAPLPPSIANWTPLRDVVSDASSDERIVAVDFGGSVTAVALRTDVVRAAARAAERDGAPERLRDLPLPEPATLDVDEPASAVLRHPGRPIVVVDEERPVGLVMPAEVDRAVAMHHLQTDEDPIAA